MSNDQDTTKRQSFTGRTFSRKPRQRVMLVDDLARRLITLSGIGSIVAVSLVGLFLVWVVLPLVMPTDIEPAAGSLPPEAALAASGGSISVVRQAVDAYGSMAWTYLDDGTFSVRGLAAGQSLPSLSVDPARRPTAAAFAGEGGRVFFGFADGGVTTGTIGFTNTYLEAGDMPADLADLPVGETAVWNDGLVERTPEGQFRHQVLGYEEDGSFDLGSGPILLADVARTPAGMVLVAVDSAGVFHDRVITWKTNMLTGERRVRTRGGSLDLAASGVVAQTRFEHLLANDTGDLATLLEPGGRAVLLRRGGDGAIAVAGDQDLVPESGASITAVTYIAGRVSLAVGDDQGGLTVWFPAPGSQGRRTLFVPVHDLDPGPAAVTSLAPSARSRILAAGHADGSVRLHHVTSGRLLGEGRQDGGAVEALAIAPREDLILATGVLGGSLWRVDAPHPETSLGSLLRPVWYEGYPGPTYVWQSSAAEDTFEPKMSLVPLIFGTLKATFYSLVFGLPLAILAAMYTSEFLSKGVRARVKPVIEIMASLPSVVLGFLAALVMAPFVEDVAVEVLAVLVCAPFFVLLGAHLWQMLPRDVAAQAESLRPVGVLVAILAGAAISWQLGPWFENVGFAGDFKAWLDGRMGTGVSGWTVLLLPASGLIVGWLNMTRGEGLIRNRGTGWSLTRLGLLDIVRFLAASALTVGLAVFAGWLLDSVGWDPRGSVFGTYVQRNALVVGIAMGFAVIPIIYTISEDALTAVPDHLRAASLGAGATHWQTMILVIVPPAMSGLFSAAMIGLGRAVGETMIVLMAAGNTPIMDMNIFNGFRTLSANLAVELPEAVQNSTHYRTLFLAALTLFVITFILNTVAEAVRLHFRGKASRL